VLFDVSRISGILTAEESIFPRGGPSAANRWISGAYALPSFACCSFRHIKRKTRTGAAERGNRLGRARPCRRDANVEGRCTSGRLRHKGTASDGWIIRRRFPKGLPCGRWRAPRPALLPGRFTSDCASIDRSKSRLFRVMPSSAPVHARKCRRGFTFLRSRRASVLGKRTGRMYARSRSTGQSKGPLKGLPRGIPRQSPPRELRNRERNLFRGLTTRMSLPIRRANGSWSRYFGARDHGIKISRNNRA